MELYKKLLKIQQRINGLGKDKSTYNYKYVTGDKLLGELKPMMNELGLILKQEVISIENTRQDYQLIDKSGTVKNKSEILSKVMMQFTWIDTETGDKDINLFGANGQNDWEKGLGSALTYGERYFLLKYFHIATDEDDIDNDKRQTSQGVPVATPQPKVPAITLEYAENHLKDALTIDELASRYKALSADLQAKTVKIKDEMKIKLQTKK